MWQKVSLVIFAIAFLFILNKPTYAVSENVTASDDTPTYYALLNPQNNSGVTGTAVLQILDNDRLMVRMNVAGVEQGLPHPQHIHGFADNRNSACPRPEDDQNGNGLIGTSEGQPFTGPPMVSLAPFPIPHDNDFSFEITYLNPDSDKLGQLMPLENRVIEIHGMNINGQYDPNLPVACGEIQIAPMGTTFSMPDFGEFTPLSSEVRQKGGQVQGYSGEVTPAPENDPSPTYKGPVYGGGEISPTPTRRVSPTRRPTPTRRPSPTPYPSRAPTPYPPDYYNRPSSPSGGSYYLDNGHYETMPSDRYRSSDAPQYYLDNNFDNWCMQKRYPGYHPNYPNEPNPPNDPNY